MSEQVDNVTFNSDSSTRETNGKKPGIKVSSSGVTTKGFLLKFNTNPQSTKPFELLEELSKLRSDETLTKDEKNERIRKMLETE